MLGLKIYENPRFVDQSRMLAALPDMGNVAGIGMQFLAKKLNAKLFAEIYSYWPPYVTYKMILLIIYRQVINSTLLLTIIL